MTPCCGVLQSPLSQSLRFVVVLWGEPSAKDAEALGCALLSFSAVQEKGRQNLTSFEAHPARMGGSDLATLVYTSGTTGNPKVCCPLTTPLATLLATLPPLRWQPYWQPNSQPRSDCRGL